MTADPGRRSSSFPRSAGAALAWAVSALVLLKPCLAPVAEPDTGFHLAIGRLIATQGIPRTNALSWTAPDFPWVANSWLFDRLGFAAMDAGGVAGLQWFVALAALLIATGLVLACREQGGDAALWIAPAASLLFWRHLTPRPHCWTEACMEVALWLCLRARGKGPALRLAAVGIAVLAGNFHSGGVFVGAIAAAFALEAALLRRSRAEAGVAALAAVGPFLGPTGLSNVGYLFANLHPEDLVAVQEFRPSLPWLDPVFYTLVALAVAASLLRWRRLPAELALVVIFAALGARATRMTWEFILIAAPVLAGALPWLRGRVGARAMTGLALAASAAALGAARVPAWWAQPAGARWDERALPVRAAEYVRRSGLGGRHFNGFRDGGYLEWALPDLPAFQDGRLQAYPAAFFHELEAADGSAVRFDRDLRARGCEWALTARRNERLVGVRVLDGNRSWALVDWDDLSEVFVRRDVPRWSALVERDEYRFFRPSGPIVGAVADAAGDDLPAYEAEVQRFQRSSPDDPYAAIVRCALASRMQRVDGAALCTRAESLATQPAQQELVRRARETGLRRR